MYWDSEKSEEYQMLEVLLSDVGNKALGRVAIPPNKDNWEAAYIDEKKRWHNLGMYLDFGIAKQIVEDRINARKDTSLE